MPISLNISKFDTTVLTASSDLKEFIHRYTNNKEIFDLQERHDSMELNTNKNFFSENYIIDVFLFITAIISFMATTLTVYLLCKNKKLRILIASLDLHQVREVGAVTQKEINTEYIILTYVSLALTILGLVMVAILHYRNQNCAEDACSLNASKNHDIHIRCTILCTYKTMQNCRKYPFIQNHRHAKTRKHQIKSKLYLGYSRNRLERSQCDF